VAQRPVVAPSVAVDTGTVRVPATVLRGTTTVQGTAMTSTNAVLTDAAVRLRDARSGRIVDVTTTDKAGLFVFNRVNPGTYVIELIGSDKSVLAASQLLNVNAGDAISAIVKLPFKIPPYAGVLGHTAPSAALITATAAASGVLATTVTATDVSPRR